MIWVVSAGCVGLPPAAPTGTGSTSGSDDVATSGASSGATATTDEPTSTTTGTNLDGSTSSTSGVESSSGGSTGEDSSVGCADGVRDALIDEVLYPELAACAGGFWIPGVTLGAPQCDRQGGDDGPMAVGVNCSIDDLCAEGWHVCRDRNEVEAAGLADCELEVWDGQFFATAQSGSGGNTCGPNGGNDVFGCGDVGFGDIEGCAPLNRSTGNQCQNLPVPWTCDGPNDEEASLLSKFGADVGGALCCRD